MDLDFIIVGSGFSGSVVAERLASAGRKVRIIDKRDHIGGNAYDEPDSNGILIHRYGPHIFHTNSDRIFEYLSRFTRWRSYEHRVLARVEGQLLPIPINRDTINGLYGLDLDEEGTREFLEKARVHRDTISSSEDVVLNSVGEDLCEKFFRGYTKKQWGMDLSELSPGVAARIPTRTNSDDRYFTDKYQAMPEHGYTRMFERMLDNSLIEVELNTDYGAVRDRYRDIPIIYSGPIDEYFSHCYGPLPYRSIRFEHEHLPDTSRYQPVGTVNYPNDHDFTRITEFRHLTGQEHTGTSIVREYPQAEGDPYYPIPRTENETLYQKYKALARNEKNVLFVGRLAQYRYYNMDQAVGAALKKAETAINTGRN